MANLAIELIFQGIKGEKMLLRCVKTDKKTIENARSCLESDGWTGAAFFFETCGFQRLERKSNKASRFYIFLHPYFSS